MFYALILLAEEQKKAPATTEQPSLLQFLFPFLLMAGVLYLVIVVFPNKRRQEKERLETINKIEKGTEVLTVGRVYATVISVSPDKDEILVKVEDGTRMKIAKEGIYKIITAEEAVKKAQEEKKK